MTSQDNEFYLEYWPSFGVNGYQKPLCVMSVFAVGMSGKDCAVYCGIVPARGNGEDYIQAVREGGDKLTETEARELFNLGDLEYRR